MPILASPVHNLLPASSICRHLGKHMPESSLVTCWDGDSSVKQVGLDCIIVSQLWPTTSTRSTLRSEEQNFL